MSDFEKNKFSYGIYNQGWDIVNLEKKLQVYI